MEPQPLRDASVHLLFEAQGDRTSTFARWTKILSHQFGQMDTALGFPAMVSESQGRAPAPTVRFFDDLISVSVQGSGLLFQTVADYPGWNKIRGRIEAVIEAAIGEFSPTPEIRRIDMRYLNFFTESRGAADIVNVEVTVPDQVGGNRTSLRVASGAEQNPGHDITVTDHVSLDESENQGVIVDIATWVDVQSRINDIGATMQQIDQAHQHEKMLFSKLMHEDVLQELTKEWEEVSNE